jgi:HAE1 family hydrophobic/amphiphilic exporter-1
MSPMQAAVEGTREIGLAVLATTLSLVAIFAPVGFMAGMVGRFMRSFGLTMAFAVMVSLLVSFTLVPTMCARWLKVKPRTEDEEHHVHDSKHSASSDRSTASTRACSSGRWRTAARREGWPVLGAVLERADLPHRERQFHAAGRSVEFDVSLRAPEGTSLEGTEVIANRVAAPSGGFPR